MSSSHITPIVITPYTVDGSRRKTVRNIQRVFGIRCTKAYNYSFHRDLSRLLEKQGNEALSYRSFGYSPSTKMIVACQENLLNL